MANSDRLTDLKVKLVDLDDQVGACNVLRGENEEKLKKSKSSEQKVKTQISATEQKIKQLMERVSDGSEKVKAK